MRGLALLAAVLLAACNVPAAAPSPTPVPVPVEKVTFIAGFKPQADLPFVAVYMAKEKGYFRDQSLEVEIQHATSGEHIQLLATDRAQFSTGSAGANRRSTAGPPWRTWSRPCARSSAGPRSSISSSRTTRAR